MDNKIYITCLHLMHGGIEMAITLQANAFSEMGYNVEILCLYNLGEPAYKLNDAVKIKYLTNLHPNRDEFKKAIKSKNPIKILKEALYAISVLRMKKSALIKEIKEIKCGTIISTRNEHSVLLSRYGNKNVRKIAQLHHDHSFNKHMLNDFANDYGNIDFFTLLTNRLTEEVRDIMKKNKHTKVITMPNFLGEDRAPMLDRRDKQVVAVGRLHSVKGFDRLIRLWKNVTSQDNTVLKIIGDGEEREKLESLIIENGLEDSVVLTGALPHDKVMEEMSKSLCYAMTSYSEGFGFVIIEAMQMGLPVVAFDVRVGPEAIIENGKSGFLISDGNTEDFVEKIVLLCENEQLLKEMSSNAISRSQAFSKGNVLKRWKEILEA